MCSTHIIPSTDFRNHPSSSNFSHPNCLGCDGQVKCSHPLSASLLGCPWHSSRSYEPEVFKHGVLELRYLRYGKRFAVKARVCSSSQRCVAQIKDSGPTNSNKSGKPRGETLSVLASRKLTGLSNIENVDPGTEIPEGDSEFSNLFLSINNPPIKKFSGSVTLPQFRLGSKGPSIQRVSVVTLAGAFLFAALAAFIKRMQSNELVKESTNSSTNGDRNGADSHASPNAVSPDSSCSSAEASARTVDSKYLEEIISSKLDMISHSVSKSPNSAGQGQYQSDLSEPPNSSFSVESDTQLGQLTNGALNSQEVAESRSLSVQTIKLDPDLDNAVQDLVIKGDVLQNVLANVLEQRLDEIQEKHLEEINALRVVAEAESHLLQEKLEDRAIIEKQMHQLKHELYLVKQVAEYFIDIDAQRERGNTNSRALWQQDLEAQVRSNQEEIAELEREMMLVLSEKNNLETRIEKVTSESELVASKLSAALEALEISAREREAERKGMNESLKKSELELEKARYAINQKQKEIAAFTAEMARWNKEVTELKDEIVQLKAIIAELKSALDESEQEEERLEEEVKMLRQRAANAEKTVSTLEMGLSALKAQMIAREVSRNQERERLKRLSMETDILASELKLVKKGSGFRRDDLSYHQSDDVHGDYGSTGTVGNGRVLVSGYGRFGSEKEKRDREAELKEKVGRLGLELVDLRVQMVRNERQWLDDQVTIEEKHIAELSQLSHELEEAILTKKDQELQVAALNQELNELKKNMVKEE